MAEALITRRVGYDIDDTLVYRDPIVRLLGFIKGRMGGVKLPKHTLDTLPNLNHTPVNVPGVDRIDLFFQRQRIAIPGVAKKLRLRASLGEQAYGVSGRRATVEWHQATTAQLERHGFPITGERVILTPLGQSNAVSKAETIRTLGLEAFNDDNLRTCLYLATLYPDIEINWIKHRLTDIPAKKALLRDRPNLRVVPISIWAR